MDRRLSSDILEQQFGPTKLDVLFQSADQRLIATRSIKDNALLEISLVVFGKKSARLFPNVQAEIKAGKSIGKAFREHSIHFERQTLANAKMAVPDKLQAKFGSSEPTAVCEISILVGDTKQPYASIVEVYSPAVDWPISKRHAPSDHMMDGLKTIESLL